MDLPFLPMDLPFLPMELPLVFRIGGVDGVGVSAHFVFEALAYTLGFATYRALRRRAGDVVSDDDRLGVIVAAIAGAAVGACVLGWLADLDGLALALREPWTLGMRKTVVGALLGGTLAVEWWKRRAGVTTRTGDLFALPLCVGIVIGRIGCLSAGLEDGTHGSASSLPWALEFGDGIARHPVRLYEMLAVAALALAAARARPQQQGDRFRIVLVGYLVVRLLVDVLKPGDTLLGLTAIQWACVAGIAVYARDVPRLAAAWRERPGA